MNEKKPVLAPEDYLEPSCLLCGEPYGAEPKDRAIPQQRIIAKMDEYMSRRDYEGAERHLLYWLEEARLGNDRRGQLMLHNELVGHYRKTGNEEKAMESAEEALRLLDELEFQETISAGTTYVNIATACNAFGHNERALELFEKARKNYESAPQTKPELLGGLYNNMALVHASLQRYDEAKALYEQAMDVMGRVENGELEQAITCLNLASLAEAELGAEDCAERAGGLLERARELLDTPSVPRDGYYAFVCEKCAPTFGWFGYFLDEQELKKRAEEIYERT